MTPVHPCGYASVLNVVIVLLVVGFVNVKDFAALLQFFGITYTLAFFECLKHCKLLDSSPSH